MARRAIDAARVAFAGLFAPLLGCFLCATAAAQSPALEVDARTLFQQGVAAVSEGLLPEAQRLFEASLRWEPNIATVYNLAAVLERIGQPLRCRDLTQEALGGRYGRTEEHAEPFVLLLETCTEALAHVNISAREGSTVELNGRLLGAVGAGAFVADLDAGEHHLLVRFEGREARRTFYLGPGETQTLELDQPALTRREVRPPELVESDVDPAESAPAPRRRRRALIVIGVLTAIGIGLGVGLAVARGDESVVDDVWGNPNALFAF